MVRLAANISTLFTDVAPEERVRLAAQCGFKAIEMQFPYEWDIDAVAGAAADRGLETVLLNAPFGDASLGELGLAGLPQARDRFKASIDLALATATKFNCHQIHVLSGQRIEELEVASQFEILTDGLAWAAQQAAAQGVNVLVEPLNRRAAPHYLVQSLDEAETIITATGAANARLLFDLYHLQIMGGDILTRFDKVQAKVGHVQVAATPTREEPDKGELDIHFLLEKVAAAGYGGWVGCEYVPKGDTIAGLGWAARYGISQAK